MPIYTQYATKAQLATYLGVEEAALPTDADRLLMRASEDVYHLVKRHYSADNEIDVEAVCLATCAQVEAWITFDETMSIAQGIENIKLGSFSLKFAASAVASGGAIICKRGKGYLMDAGLLYSGLKADDRSGENEDT